MPRAVEHEVTIVAFDANGDLVDIIETSRHYAYRFLSRLRRNVWGDASPATTVAVLSPGALLSGAAVNCKPIGA